MSWLTLLLRSLGWERQAKRPTPPVIPPKPDVPPVTNLVAIINETRQANGVGPVWEFKPLDEAAKIQADWQAKTDTLRHDGPPSMPSTEDRLRAVGIDPKRFVAGEICAQGQKVYWGPDAGPLAGKLVFDYDMRDACNAWLNSPGHRITLLDKDYTHAGAWMSTAPSGRIYSTAVFLRVAK